MGSFDLRELQSLPFPMPESQEYAAAALSRERSFCEIN